MLCPGNWADRNRGALQIVTERNAGWDSDIGGGGGGAGFRASDLLTRQLILGRWQFPLGERDTEGDPSKVLFLKTSTEFAETLVAMPCRWRRDDSHLSEQNKIPLIYANSCLYPEKEGQGCALCSRVSSHGNPLPWQLQVKSSAG